MPHSTSILKKTLLPPSIPSQLSGRSREDRNRDTALYHADLLQQRKEAEAQIFASLETLLDLPSSPAANAACPSNADSAIVKNSLKPFQPSDYDSLIEERNISKQCGYVLCPKSNRQENTRAKYRILQSGGRGRHALKIVETNTLERWCSDDCGKRALYLKVQLNEEPAWTRTNTTGDVALLIDGSMNERGGKPESGLIEHLKSLDIGQLEDEVVAQTRALAIERGDGIAPSRTFGLADIRENIDTNSKVSAPGSGTKDRMVSNSIEGYTPRFSGRRLAEKDHDNVEDIMETI